MSVEHDRARFVFRTMPGRDAAALKNRIVLWVRAKSEGERGNLVPGPDATNARKFIQERNLEFDSRFRVYLGDPDFEFEIEDYMWAVVHRESSCEAYEQYKGNVSTRQDRRVGVPCTCGGTIHRIEGPYGLFYGCDNFADGGCKNKLTPRRVELFFEEWIESDPASVLEALGGRVGLSVLLGDEGVWELLCEFDGFVESVNKFFGGRGNA